MTRTCPDGHGTMTHRGFPGSAVVLDACPTCGGLWAERGELQALEALRDASGRKDAPLERLRFALALLLLRVRRAT